MDVLVAPTKYHLEFNNICYEVAVKGSTKPILQHITSECVSGKLTAIMGPSGAGKSSLLDILAGVKVAGKAKGQILLNGVPRKECRFSALCSYVQQKDVLVPSATVREALVTSALLKLPHSMPKAAKLQRVDELLSLLELSHVSDSFIGDEAMGIKGISGGEKRRVSVGVEVVKDPAIIFLDEPTTGLDSEMALGVITSLKAMAEAGKMVVATIHQPNSMITDHFDDWALLAKGRQLYAGPWSDAVPYFEAAGYPCPLYMNPTDYFISLASHADTITALEQLFVQHKQGTLNMKLASLSEQQLSSKVPHWHNGAVFEVAGAAADDSSSTLEPASCLHAYTYHNGLQQQDDSGSSGCCIGYITNNSSQHIKPSASFSSSSSMCGAVVSFLYQVWVLMVRFCRCWVRTPIMATAEAAQYFILALFLGLLYLRSPAVLPDAPYDRMSAIFVVLVTLSFIPSYTVMVVWDHERQLLRRETSTNMYSRSAFFVAKTLTTTPIEVAQITVFAVASYFMFGFQAVASKFLIWWVVLVVFTLCSETIGYMAAIVTPDSKVGVAVLSIVLLLLVSFSGYLVRSIPFYFAWIRKISYFSFANDILVQNEFNGLIFTGPKAGGPFHVPGQALVPAAMKTGLGMGGNIAVLIGITLGCRGMCLLLLEMAARWKFL